MRFLFSVIAYFVGGIMAVGAMFGALNTMSSAVTARSTEIATLRAIGFNPASVVCAVLAEALFLGIAGALLGAALVWLFIGGTTFSSRAEDGAVIVQLEVTIGLVLTGVAWACVIGAIGGLVPGIRVGRMPVATALREI
jgi:putative ABC transport system permease protein